MIVIFLFTNIDDDISLFLLTYAEVRSMTFALTVVLQRVFILCYLFVFCYFRSQLSFILAILFVSAVVVLLFSVCSSRVRLHRIVGKFICRHRVDTVKERKERKWTFIAPIVSITRPLSAQMWITQSYLQIHHICLSFVYAFARARTAVNSFTHLSAGRYTSYSPSH